MITPRESFRTGPFHKGWLDVCDSAQFHMAATTAMAQMVIEQPFPRDTATAQAKEFELQGAKKFLNLLMNLSAPDPKASAKPGTNLDHKA